MGRSDSPPSLSPRFVAFAWRYHPCVAVRSRRPGRTAGGLGVGDPVPAPDMSVETAGSPRFPGTPRVPWPCSPTPAGPDTPGPLRRAGAAPAFDKSKGSRDDLSRLNRTAWALAVYASQWESPPPTQDSLPAAGQALPGGIRATRRVPLKGFRVRVSSSFPELSWRNAN